MRAWLSKLFAPYGPETKKVHMTFFFGSWAILAFIGLLIPETVLTDHPSLRAFTDFMASFIPQIDRVTALGLKPEINRLHYSILWAVSPVFPGLMLPSLFVSFFKNRERRMTYGQAFLVLLVSAWLICETMFLCSVMVSPPNWVYNPPNTTLRAMFYIGLWRAIYAPVLVFGFWMFSTFVLIVLLSLLTGRLHRAAEGETNEGKTHG